MGYSHKGSPNMTKRAAYGMFVNTVSKTGRFLTVVGVMQVKGYKPSHGELVDGGQG